MVVGSDVERWERKGWEVLKRWIGEEGLGGKVWEVWLESQEREKKRD
jgi:hypothetical protein